MCTSAARHLERRGLPTRTLCCPAASSSVSGVVPRSPPSTYTSAPAGRLETRSSPVEAWKPAGRAREASAEREASTMREREQRSEGGDDLQRAPPRRRHLGEERLRRRSPARRRHLRGPQAGRRRVAAHGGRGAGGGAPVVQRLRRGAVQPLREGAVGIGQRRADARERGGQLRGGLEAVARLRRGRLVEHLAERVAAADVGSLRDDAAEGEDVRLRADRIAGGLLRRHVARLPLRPRGRIGHLGAAARARDAEVAQVDAAAAREQHVVRRDVAVDEVEGVAVAVARRVRRVQRPRHLRADVRGQCFRHQLVPAARDLERAPQRAAVHELQHEDGAFPLRFQVIEGGHDARVVEEPDQARFVRQHGGDPRVPPPLRRQHLDDHPAAERSGPLQLGQPDLAHAAQPEPLDEHVAPADPVALSELAQRASGR